MRLDLFLFDIWACLRMSKKKRQINWSFVGEWVFIFLFCILYSLIANVQSRVFPVNGSMAYEVRKEVDFELNRLNEKHMCEDESLQFHRRSKMIWVWYENKETNEYWCGMLNPDRLTIERLEELAPHIQVLNSDKSIRRIASESDKHISR